MSGSTPPAPYLHFAGTAREALHFYAGVFGGSVELHTFKELRRTDGTPAAVAHGYLTGGFVQLFASDAAPGEAPFRSEGMMFSLLGTADASTLRRWFAGLSEGGTIVDDLRERPWGAFDGQVVDRFGLHWLIGFEEDDAP